MSRQRVPFAGATELAISEVIAVVASKPMRSNNMPNSTSATATGHAKSLAPL